MADKQEPGASGTPAAPAQVCVRLIGSPRLVLASGMVHSLERHDAGLMALVALKGRVLRGHAARLLWPSSPLPQAQSSLRQRLFRLRRIAAAQVVQGEGDMLCLGSEVVHDLGDMALRLQIECTAMDGELLDGFHYNELEEFDHWLGHAREQWRRERRRLLAQEAEALEADGRIAQALVHAERLLADDLLAEHAHRRVMRLHYRRGDRSAALAAADRCRSVLAEEGGTEPAPETRELMRLVARAESGSQTAPGRPIPVALLRPPRLVGRQDEWWAIERAWARGRSVLLSGEAGIGKTRLAADFAAARQGVLVCYARPGDAALPYAVAARVLEALVDEFGPPRAAWARTELSWLAPGLGPAVPGATPLRLRQALHQAMTDWASGTSHAPLGKRAEADGADGNSLLVEPHGPRPLSAEFLALPRQDAGCWHGLVIEDLQFADADSLGLLLSWLGGEAACRCLLTVRAAEVPPALADWRATQPDDGWFELSLAPLNVAGVESLLQSLAVPGLEAPAWAVPLLQHTGGNPMFILETLIALLDRGQMLPTTGAAALPAPQSVGRLIEQRLLALPAPALRLARVAALAGVDFDAELAAAVLAVHVLDLAADWATLESAQVLRDGAFAHDLILEAAVRQVPQHIARVIHCDIARELQRRDRPSARTAEHWHAGQAWPQAATHFERAAQAMATLGRRDEEMRLLQRAAECHDRAGAAAPAFHARRRAAQAMAASGSLGEALRQLDALQDQAVDDPQRLAVGLQQAEVRLTAYDADAGRVAAESALALADSLGDAQGSFDAARMLGSALALQEHIAQALSVLQDRAPHPPEGASEASRGAFHSTMGYVLARADRRSEAIEHWGLAAELAERTGNLPDALIDLTNLAGAVSLRGRVEEALALAERAARLRMRMGESGGVGVGTNQNMIGLACTVLGRYDRALAALESALACFRTAGAETWVMVTEGLLANLFLTLGQRARARQALGAVPAGTRAAQRARRLVIEARIERAGGGTGLAKLHQAMWHFNGQRPSAESLVTRLALATALEPQTARLIFEEITNDASEKELPSIAMSAEVRLAQTLTRLGLANQAAALAESMVERVEHCLPHDLYRGEFWWILCQAFEAAGHAEASNAALCRGVAWVNEASGNVPAPFKDSFAQRNAINRDLLALAGRRKSTL